MIREDFLILYFVYTVFTESLILYFVYTVFTESLILYFVYTVFTESLILYFVYTVFTESLILYFVYTVFAESLVPQMIRERALTVLIYFVYTVFRESLVPQMTSEESLILYTLCALCLESLVTQMISEDSLIFSFVCAVLTKITRPTDDQRGFTDLILWVHCVSHNFVLYNRQFHEAENVCFQDIKSKLFCPGESWGWGGGVTNSLFLPNCSLTSKCEPLRREMLDHHIIMCWMVAQNSPSFVKDINMQNNENKIPPLSKHMHLISM